ncbi:MAG: hypothetical protein AB7G25_05525 [Sphingomonadaceae bacterium]
MGPEDDYSSLRRETAASNEDFMAQFVVAEPDVAKISDEMVASALDGFALESVKDSKWMGRSVRTAYYLIRILVDKTLQPVTPETTKEVLAAAKAARELKRKLAAIPEGIRSKMLEIAYRKSVTEDPALAERISFFEDSPLALAKVESNLSVFADFLTDAAHDIRANHRPKTWRLTQLKSHRTELAALLSLTFERAYGRPATVNRWEASDGSVDLGPWADFFGRICALLMNEACVPSLERVLSAARRLTKSDIGEFGMGMMPK